MKLLTPTLIAIAALTTWGCTHTDEGDTSPLPPVDPQTRLAKATQSIESSNMTPEQKKAALEYVKQNAATASKMKESAQTAQAGSKP